MATYPHGMAPPPRFGRADDAARPPPPTPEHLDSIEQSHERCAAIGLSRIERPDHAPLGRSDLTVARERNLRLHSHAAPVMEMLHEQIVNSGSMVVLCDATGTIIHSIGDDDFLLRASKVALQPGVNWSEPAKGTNAIGTALVRETPTLVHADEHFMHANQFLTCSAAPILDPRGNVLGVLDVTGDHRSYHQHTMALVKMSARMIENHWLSDDFRHVMRLHFHARVEFIGTLMEGILAVSPDGHVVGANRSALDQLGLSGMALRMQTLPSLFGTTVSSLVDHFRSPQAMPLPLVLPDGRRLHLQARFNWPVWHAPATAPADDAGDAGADIVAGPVRAAPKPGPRAAAGAVGAPAPAAGHSPASAGVAAAAPAPDGPCTLDELQTGDAQVDAVVGKIRRVLDRGIALLLLGEAGTGKSLLARAVHGASQRRGGPFVAVDCGAWPAGLDPVDLVTAAEGGTLFLDEVGDLPAAGQARLLRALRDARPRAGVALVSATRRNLRERVEAQAFDADLHDRLNGLAVRLPALRDRSDLPALADRMLADLSPGHALRIEPAVLALLQHGGWPGNLRQLRNVLRTAAVMAASDAAITPDHLGDDVLEAARHAMAVRAATAASTSAPADAPMPAVAVAPSSAHAVPAVPAAPGTPATDTAAGPLPPAGSATGVDRLDAVEMAAIRAAVDAAGGNISKASKQLGISRNTIYRKLRWNVAG